MRKKGNIISIDNDLISLPKQRVDVKYLGTRKAGNPIPNFNIVDEPIKRIVHPLTPRPKTPNNLSANATVDEFMYFMIYHDFKSCEAFDLAWKEWCQFNYPYNKLSQEHKNLLGERWRQIMDANYVQIPDKYEQFLSLSFVAKQEGKTELWVHPAGAIKVQKLLDECMKDHYDQQELYTFKNFFNSTTLIPSIGTIDLKIDPKMNPELLRFAKPEGI